MDPHWTDRQRRPHDAAHDRRRCRPAPPPLSLRPTTSKGAPMKAIVYHEYGSARRAALRRRRAARPSPPTRCWCGSAQPRSTSATGSRCTATPLIRLAFGLRRPKATILGRDIAGTVDGGRRDVTRWRAGDEVFGEVSQRGFAEYVAAPETRLAAKPAGVTFEQAATLPVAGDAPRCRRCDSARSAAGPAGAGQRGLGRRRHVRRAARQDARRRGDRRVQHPERRPGPLDRRGPRDRLHPRGLHRGRTVRRHHRPRRRPPARASSAGRSRRRACTSRRAAPVAAVLGPLPRLFAVLATSPFVSQRMRALAATLRWTT